MDALLKVIWVGLVELNPIDSTPHLAESECYVRVDHFMPQDVTRALKDISELQQ